MSTWPGPGIGTSTTEISVRLADLHYAACDPNGRETLALHAETRVRAEVDLKSWQLQEIRAGERIRRGPTCDEGDWRSRARDLEGLTGRSLFGGMNRYCLERFGSDTADERLLSALLCLAPGMTQVGAGLSENLAASSSSRPLGGGLGGPGPCFMLRSEGPLMASIRSTGSDDA